MVYSEDDQQQNCQWLIDCFLQVQWVKEVDVSDKEVCCGVCCVICDYLLMVGNVFDYEVIFVEYVLLVEQKDEVVSVLVFDDFFMFVVLGFCGLCFVLLCVEILVVQMSDELILMDVSMLVVLNLNWLWVWKLLKGKVVKVG